MITSPFSILYHHRELLVAWTMRVIRARYQQSILGGLWAIVQPVATVAIFTTVFSIILKIETGNIPYVIFAYSALVPWMLFSSSITDMAESIVTNMNLIGKIYFPRDILVIAALLARLMDFFIAYTLLILLMLFYKLPIFQVTWLFLPILLLVQLSLALGLGLFLAALNAFYRDIKHLVTLILQLWLYATPIIYPVDRVPEAVKPFYFLNPMAGVIEGYRAIMIHGRLPDTTLLISAVTAVIILVFGYWVFKRVEQRFADII